MKAQAKFRVGDKVYTQSPSQEDIDPKPVTIIGCFSLPDKNDAPGGHNDFYYALKEQDCDVVVIRTEIESCLWPESCLFPVAAGTDFVDDDDALASFFNDSKEAFLIKYAGKYSENDWNVTAKVLKAATNIDISKMERKVINTPELSEDEITEAIKVVRDSQKKVTIKGTYEVERDKTDPCKISLHTEVDIGDAEILTDYLEFVYVKWGWYKINRETEAGKQAANELISQYAKFYAGMFKTLKNTLPKYNGEIKYDFIIKNKDLYLTVDTQICDY